MAAAAVLRGGSRRLVSYPIFRPPAPLRFTTPRACGRGAPAALAFWWSTLHKNDLHKPVCTIGCSNQGKSTLTAAVTKVLSDAGCFNDVNLHQEKLSAFGMPTIEYQTNTRRYNHFDSPGNTNLLNISKISPPIGAGIVVVSAIDGPMKKTQELILHARELGVPSLVCFLSKVDLVDNPQLLQRMEDELREFIYLGKYSCDESPIIQGSALHALQGVNAAFGRDSIMKLVDSLDQFSDNLSQEILHKNELAIAQASESTAVLSQVKFQHENQLAIPQSSSSTAIMSLVKVSALVFLCMI